MRNGMYLLDQYKRWTRKQYDRYYYEYDFQPNFKWNPFDTNNEWVYRNQKWTYFILGWGCIAHAWEAWSCLMNGSKYYSYKLPRAFWYELSDGWLDMEKKWN